MSTPEQAWSKSSYSTGDNDSCVEVALSWRKSSHSGGDGNECVEVAVAPRTIHVRDSKDTARPHLALSPAAWRAFISYTTRGS
ncbi:DUF397 domain-containing protein [Streptomyces sp. ODS28]|uniref:DUF397 domain-containing protein n=1 Tax=Streptomyces sp. ODS28 TaxID=3136688 RepID=UPI0031F1AF6F